MTSTELQKAIVSILRNLDTDDPVVRSFHSAFRYRQQNATTFESESDSLALETALERAFVVYTPDEVWSGEVDPEGPNMFFALDLATAAESIPLGVYQRLVRRLEHMQRELKDEADVRQFLMCAFCAYVRRKEENLSPGP